MKLSHLLALCGGLAGAGAASQLPEFTQQYLQRLGGRLDELGRQAAAIARDAQAEGLSVERYLELFRESSVTAHRRVGARLAEGLLDFESQQAAYRALVEASPLGRPLVLLGHLDGDLALATLDSYNPALPLTSGGLLYALGGGLLVAAVLLFAGRLAASVRRRAGVGARSRQTGP